MELLSPNHHSHWVYHTMVNDASGALDLRVRRNMVGYLDVQPITYKALSASPATTIGGARLHSASAQRQHGDSSSTGYYSDRVLDDCNSQQPCPGQWFASAEGTDAEHVSRRLQEVPECAEDIPTRFSPPMGAPDPSITRLSPPMGTPGPSMTRLSPPMGTPGPSMTRLSPSMGTPGPSIARHSSDMKSPIMISPVIGTTRSSPAMTHTSPSITQPCPTMAKPRLTMTSHRPAVGPMPAVTRSGPATQRQLPNQPSLSWTENTPNCGQSISGQGKVSSHLLSPPHSKVSSPFGLWKDMAHERKGHCTDSPQDAGRTAAEAQWTEKECKPSERRTVILMSTSEPVYTVGYTKPTLQEDFGQQERARPMVSLDRQDGDRQECEHPTGCRCRDVYHTSKVRNTSSVYVGSSQDTTPSFVSTDFRNRSSESDMIRVMSESLSCVNRSHGDPSSYPIDQHVHNGEDQSHTPKDTHYWTVTPSELAERRKPQPPPFVTMPSSTHNYNTKTTSFSPLLSISSLKSEHSPESSLMSSNGSCRSIGNIVRMVAKSFLDDSADTFPNNPPSTYPLCSPNNSPTMSLSSSDSLSPNLLRHTTGPLPAVFDPSSSPPNLSHCPESDQMDCSSSSSSSGSSFEQLSPTSKPEELLPIPRHVLESSSDSESVHMEEAEGGPGRPIRPVDRLPMRHWLLEQLDRNDVPGLEWLVKRELVFRVPWKHGSRHGWTLEHDACLFVRWAKYTGRLSRHSRPDARRMKANFRSALNSLPDVEQVKGMNRMRGQDAFRVYRFLQPKKRVTK